MAYGRTTRRPRIPDLPKWELPKAPAPQLRLSVIRLKDKGITIKLSERTVVITKSVHFTSLDSVIARVWNDLNIKGTRFILPPRFTYDAGFGIFRLQPDDNNWRLIVEQG